MTRIVVSLNAGSSSIKFGLYRLRDSGEPIHVAGGLIGGIGVKPHLSARSDDGSVVMERDWDHGEVLSHEDLLGSLIEQAHDYLGHHQVVAIGHRVVHGGTDFVKPVCVDDDVLDRLEALTPLAPLHQPHNLAAVEAMRSLLPDVPQVACFDTAFHSDKPELAARMPLPRALFDRGIRRYGFHGLSYEYIARRLAELDPHLAQGRVITAHLGNGASLCAMLAGKSVDTTMGFTALDGLMMGTRCGSIDPGVVLHLIQHEGMSAREVEHLLYKDSGLLGVSGISSDMRVLSKSEAPQAEEAMALFALRAAQETGALMASTDGLDGLVFTAGIGEHHAGMRARICQALEWAGVTLNDTANQANAPVISTPDSAVTVRVIPTDEERMIALHALSTVGIYQGDHA